MNFKFTNLLGAPYRGGNLLIHDNVLLTPVGNRVGQIDLVHSTSQTLPFENLKQIRTLCVSPDGALMLSIDEEGRALLVNRKRGALLHHFSFKGAVSVAKFSPCGKYIAAGVGRLVQVWLAPSFEKQLAPMQLHRTYGQCHSEVVDLDWSHDSQFIAVASKDIVARVFSLHPLPGYEPPVLSGHKDAVVAAFFTGPATRKAALVDGKELPVLCTLSRDGALLTWTFTPSSLQPAKAAAAGSGQGGKAGSAGAKGKGAGGKRSQAEAADGDVGDGSGWATTVVTGTGPVPKKQRLADGSAAAALEAARAALVAKLREDPGSSDDDPLVMPYLAGGRWALGSKDYCNLRGGAKVTAASFHKAAGLLVVGTSTGLFDLYQLPGFENLQTLSISREAVTSVAFNATGDWVAVGCARLGQLLVWEWRSDSYVMKQQGHVHDIRACAFSPDGALLATGGDDRKVKLFQQSSGFCFVTFSDHAAPVTALAFLPAGQALVTASLDGTVRAFDLVRYRNFRTMTSPSPVQFSSLAVDAGGEVVAAGTADTFQIYVWSLKTGRLLDVLAGHEGPVSCLAFGPPVAGAAGGLLASGSWDKTVRTWDVFSGKGGTESLQHTHDVLALAFRPDGRQLAVATLNGDITLWDPSEGELQHTIEGRRDVRGGRLAGDRRAAGNSASGTSFTSLAFSADGAYLLAGGSSRYVLIYDVSERVMLRRFATTSNRSLDGVLDTLNSKHMTDAGPLGLIDHEGVDEDDAGLLPAMVDGEGAEDLPGTSGRGAAAGRRPPARTRCVALSPTGRTWAAATTEGVVLYGLDDDLLFDPTDLNESITPAECRKALAAGSYVRAALIALRLGDPGLLRAVIFGTSPAQVSTVASALPIAFVPQLLTALAEYLEASPHLEFLLQWAKAACVAHGPHLESAGMAAHVRRGSAAVAAAALPALRSLQKSLTRVHEDIATSCESNVYTLQYLLAAGEAGQGADEEEEEEGVQGAGGSSEEEAGSGSEDMAGSSGEEEEEDSEEDQAAAGKKSSKKPLVSVGRIGGSRVAGLAAAGGSEDEEDGEDGSGDDGAAGVMPGWG